MKKLFKKLTPYTLGLVAIAGLGWSVYAVGMFDLEYHVDVRGGGCQYAYGNPGYKPGDTVYIDHESIVKYHTGTIAVIQNTGKW